MVLTEVQFLPCAYGSATIGYLGKLLAREGLAGSSPAAGCP